MLDRLKATPPWAVVVLVLVAATAWVVAVRDRHADELERREWNVGQPPELVRAGPTASWAAACCPTLAQASTGLRLGGRVTYYPGNLSESGASIIGWEANAGGC